MEIVDLPISLRDLSDNLRNPLTGILGFVQLLKASTLTEEQIEYLKYIEVSGNKLQILADKLLKAKKIKINS